MIDKPADRMLDKYLHRDHPSRSDATAPQSSSLDAAPTLPTSPGAAEDSTDDLGCFGYLRGVRDRALMLELRKSDGSIMAIGYSWLERAEFDPTDGITLHLTGRTIKIKGTNLNAEVRPHVRLFNSITRHRVPWLRARGAAAEIDSNEQTTVVTTIDW